MGRQLSPRVRIGLENCLTAPPAVLRKARFAVLCNQASVDETFRYTHDLLQEAFPGQPAALFSPQHGLWSQDQDNMVETGHGWHRRLGVPVYSLYADTRKPTSDMLTGLDCLVVDLQDVGTRVYTYAWTLTYCLEACAEQGVSVVVLDRPNPLGGRKVEGPRLDPAYASFVGRAPIPMRHGLTLGELALYLNDTLGLNAEVHVTPMTGWTRGTTWSTTGRHWIPASPNLPRMEGVQVYPGMVLVEGTNLSEGRGTTTPFEIFGAPFIDAEALVEALSAWHLPGVTFRPLAFKPTFQKWRDELCHGVFLHVTDEEAFLPYRTAVVLLDCVRKLYPEQVEWQPPPYEYEYERMPLDLLSGGPHLRTSLEGGLTPAALQRLTTVDEAAWWQETAPYLLY